MARPVMLGWLGCHMANSFEARTEYIVDALNKPISN